MENELIKEPDIKDIKRLIDKYEIKDDDFSMNSVNIKCFIEWYEKNKGKDTAGGRVSTYDIFNCVSIFADEVNYVRELI